MIKLQGPNIQSCDVDIRYLPIVIEKKVDNINHIIFFFFFFFIELLFILENFQLQSWFSLSSS